MELTGWQKDYVDGLRDLADHLEQRPDLIPSTGQRVVRFIIGGASEFAKTALQLGTSTKDVDESYYSVTRKFGPHEIMVTSFRDAVCERVVVESQEITKQVPDPEVVANAPLVEVTETVEIVEWKCPDSLHALAGD